MSPDVNLETVRTYLMDCGPDLACKIFTILQRSLTYGKDQYGKDQSARYVVEECKKCDSNSPIVQLLKDKNNWPKLMTIGDEVAKERQLDVERLYE